MGIKYIRNTDDATIVCRIASDRKRAFVFHQKKIDKRNNIVLSNGYTEISEEDLALLAAESNTYAVYTKAGKLTVTDSLPQDSMSAEQLVTALRTENASLKRQLAMAQKATSDPEEMAGLQKQIVELQQELAEAKELPQKISELQDKLSVMNEEHKQEISDMQDTIDALTEQLLEKPDTAEAGTE